jgi:DNA repair exonuclease SbcCD nuclease subunit
VLHLGDLKNSMNPVDQRATNFLVRAAQSITELCPLLVVAGNHDRIGMGDHTESCLPVLAAAGAVTFEEPTLHELGKGVWLHAVPFFRDEEKFKAALRKKANKKDILIMAFHQELSGCCLNTQAAGKSLLPASLLRGYDFCLGGHIHYRQRIGENILYVGSPFCHDWGEANQEKSLTLVDIR